LSAGAPRGRPGLRVYQEQGGPSALSQPGQPPAREQS